VDEFLTVKVDTKLVIADLLLANTSQVQRAETRPRAPIYPFGRCLAVLAPGQGRVDSVYLYPGDLNSSLAVYMRDPVNTVDYFPIPSAMHGDTIKMMAGKFVKYRTEIGQAVYDPELGCEEYTRNRSLAACMRGEVRARLEALLGCTPPLLAGEGESVCRGLNVTKERSDAVKQVFLEVDSVDSRPAGCRGPCTRTSYETKRTFYLPSDNTGIRIALGGTVQEERTRHSISDQTFLVRLGGSVSGGR
jgi:hypothetical protein